MFDWDRWEKERNRRNRTVHVHRPHATLLPISSKFETNVVRCVRVVLRTNEVFELIDWLRIRPESKEDNEGEGKGTKSDRITSSRPCRSFSKSLRERSKSSLTCSSSSRNCCIFLRKASAAALFTLARWRVFMPAVEPVVDVEDGGRKLDIFRFVAFQQKIEWREGI